MCTVHTPSGFAQSGSDSKPGPTTTLSDEKINRIAKLNFRKAGQEDCVFTRLAPFADTAVSRDYLKELGAKFYAVATSPDDPLALSSVNCLSVNRLRSTLGEIQLRETTEGDFLRFARDNLVNAL